MKRRSRNKFDKKKYQTVIVREYETYTKYIRLTMETKNKRKEKITKSNKHEIIGLKSLKFNDKFIHKSAYSFCLFCFHLFLTFHIGKYMSWITIITRMSSMYNIVQVKGHGVQNS